MECMKVTYDIGVLNTYRFLSNNVAVLFITYVKDGDYLIIMSSYSIISMLLRAASLFAFHVI